MPRRPDNSLSDRLLAAQRELNALSASADESPVNESPGNEPQPTPPVIIRRRRRVMPEVEAGPSDLAENSNARAPRVFVRPASAPVPVTAREDHDPSPADLYAPAEILAALERRLAEVQVVLQGLTRIRPAFELDLGVNVRWDRIDRQLAALRNAVRTDRPWLR